MTIYKSIAYAFATSTRAKQLGFSDTGCFFVQRRDANNSFVDADCEGFLKANDPDLIEYYMLVAGTHCPMFLRHGNQDALNAIRSVEQRLREHKASQVPLID